jgi:hypothetical protein
MCKNHKLHNLLKLSQVQMRLFPHKTVESKPNYIFANIVDEETAICSICEKNIPFIEDEADEGPDGFSSNSEYVYTQLKGLSDHDINSTIAIDPVVPEQWIPEDSQGYKENVIRELENISKSFKSVGELVYSDIFEKPFNVTVKFDSSFLFPTSSSIVINNGSRNLNIVNSTFVISTDCLLYTIDSSQILSWVINNNGSEEDITADIEEIRATLRQGYKYSEFVKLINDALRNEFYKRLYKLITENNLHNAIKSFYEILPIIFDEIKNKDTLKFIAEINNFLNNIELNNIEKEKNEPLFESSLSQLFLTASDNLNSTIRNMLESNDPISTRVDIRSTFNVRKNTTTKAYDKYLLPICLECAEEIFTECSECSDVKFEEEMGNADGSKICQRCLENFSSCDECDDMVRVEDMHWSDEDEQSYCESCWRRRAAEKTNVDDFDNPVNLAASNLFFLTGNKQSLEKLLNSLEGLKNKTKGGPASKLRQDFINIFKANGIKEDEAKIIISTMDNAGSLHLMGDPVGEQDFKWYIDGYIKAINNYMSHQESFYSKYPLAIDGDVKTQNIYSGKKIELLKNYQPIPVTYEYDSANRGKNNFVIKMMPTTVFIQQAEVLFPGVGKNAWQHFSNSGTQHHRGCIAYARISYDGENMVIDNLQRDADLNNAKPDLYKAKFSSDPDRADMAEKALRWFDKRTSKWYIQFADYLINFAKENDKKLYLTNFQTQKAKWRNVPDKNMEVYDNLPEEMASASFYRKLQEMKREDPTETAESLAEKVRAGSVSVYPVRDDSPDPNLKIEDLRSPVGGIWRLAKKNRVFCLFKKSK